MPKHVAAHLGYGRSSRRVGATGTARRSCSDGGRPAWGQNPRASRISVARVIVMPASLPGVSPTLQALIDKGVLNRIPVSFSAFCIDQMREWELLFPAERSYYERLFSLFDRSSAAAVRQLFAPIREIEPKMGVNEKTWPSDKFTLEQVDFLNRNPYYPEWRGA